MPILSLLTTTRSRLLSSTAFIRYYAAGGFNPEFVADFVRGEYSAAGNRTFASTIDHSASGLATMTGGYGPELISNGGFIDGSTGWTLGTNWVVSDGRGRISTAAGVASDLSYQVTIPEAGAYIFEFSATSDAGLVGISFYDGTATRTDAGTYSNQGVGQGRLSRVFTFSAGGTFTVRAAASATWTGTVDDFTCRKMPVVQWRPHNLLTYSEDFSQWTETIVTEGTSTSVASDLSGVSEAIEVTVPTSGRCYVSRDVSFVVGGQYTVRFYIEEASDLDGVLNGVSLAAAVASGDSSYDVSEGETGWASFTFVASASSAAIRAGIGLTGAAAGTVRVSAVHVYRSDLGGMAKVPSIFRSIPSLEYYVPNKATAIGPELVTNGTFDSDTTGWTAGKLAGTADGVLSVDANRLKITNGSPDGYGAASQSMSTVVGKTYTFSVDYTVGNSDRRIIRLGTGLYSTSYVSDAISSGATSGTITHTFVATSTVLWVSLANYGGAGDTSIWDNISVQEVDRLPTSALYLPRIGHHVYNGSQWVDEGLLHESEARTNLAIGVATTTGVTETLNAATSITGELDAIRFTRDATDPRYARIAYPGFTASATTTYTCSLYFKWDGNDVLTSLEYNNFTDFDSAWRVDFNLTSSGMSVSSEASATGGVEDVGNGWYRGYATFTTGAAPSTSTSSTLIEISGGNSVLVYGPQLEPASTPSSYLPTSGATVTRAAETLTIPYENLTWSSEAVSMQMDGRMTYADDGASETFFRWYGSSTNRVQAYLDLFSTYAGRVTFLQNSGTNIVVASETYSPDILVPFNIASRHGSTFINGAVDGVALTEDTTPVALPDLSTTDLELGYNFMGTIKKFRMWADDIGDTGIEEATEPSLEPSLSLTFDGSGTSFTVFDWSE